MRIRVFALIALAAISALWPCAARAATAGARDLIGVWSSERDFSPALNAGEVVLRRHGDNWDATIAKESATSRGSSGASFHFPAGDELHIRLRGPDILGQWVQPATVSTGYRFATPVRFAQVEDDVWSGQIHPLADVQHMTLILRSWENGSVIAFLRNPESNVGARWGTRRVTLHGDEVRFTRGGSPDVVGHFAAGVLSFDIPGYPGTFAFERTQPSEAAAETATPMSVPLRTGDGWVTGTLDDAGLDGLKIDALLALMRAPATSPASPYIQSLQIARHGDLVVDEYFNGFSIDRPHDVRSAGKSVTTLLVGRVIQDGAPISPSSRIAPLFLSYAPFANNDPRKQGITIADLMTMSPGYACDDNDDASPGNEDTMESQTAQPSWYKFTLDLPMAYDPGSRAVYCSAGINLLGAIVQQQTRLSLEDYFYDRFAAPMQFGPYAMWLMPPPLSAAYMGGGDYFLPRDFLKFGELFLEHGRWNGRTIIDDRWLVAAAQPRAGLNSPGDYGYGWHLYTYAVGGRTIKAISAGGNGGQLLFVFPQLDMTVMITAANYGQYPVWQKFITQLVPDYILAAAK